MQALKNEAAKELTQYELTTEVITKLNTFKLTPTAKLVLLYLTTCYNPKHGEIFPKQKTIAIKLGVSERSVTRAIQELFNEGLILIECKYTNRYKFTSKIAQKCPENLSENKRQNVIKETDKLSLPYIEQINLTNKQQTELLNNKGGNVYSGDDEILADYAVKHNAKNISAYIAKLKETKSAEKIINEYKSNVQKSQIAFKLTDLRREIREQERQNSVLAETCTTYVEWGRKHGLIK